MPALGPLPLALPPALLALLEIRTVADRSRLNSLHNLEGLTFYLYLRGSKLRTFFAKFIEKFKGVSLINRSKSKKIEIVIMFFR